MKRTSLPNMIQYSTNTKLPEKQKTIDFRSEANAVNNATFCSISLRFIIMPSVQARRQDSVTGGARNKFGEGHEKFTYVNS